MNKFFGTAIVLQKLTVYWANKDKFINVTFAILGILLKSVVPCDKLFNSAGSMDALKRWKYGLESDCTLCGKVFSSRMQLDRHEKTIHYGQPQHTCQFYSKGFMNKCHMNKHMELCTRGREGKKYLPMSPSRSAQCGTWALLTARASPNTSPGSTGLSSRPTSLPGGRRFRSDRCAAKHASATLSEEPPGKTHSQAWTGRGQELSM